MARSSPLRVDGRRAPGVEAAGPGQSRPPLSTRPGPLPPPKTPRAAQWPTATRAPRGSHPREWTGPPDRGQATRALRLLRRHYTLGPCFPPLGGSVCPPPRTMTGATGITWQVCVNIR